VSSWKGDTWMDKPSIICYKCIIDNFNEIYLNELEYEYGLIYDNMNEVENNIEGAIKDFIDKVILADGGMEGISTTSKVVAHDNVKPNSWNSIKEKLEEYI